MVVIGAGSDASAPVPLVRGAVADQAVAAVPENGIGAAQAVDQPQNVDGRLPVDQQSSLSIRSRFDESLSRSFFEVVDLSSNRVIIQFPPERIVRAFRAVAIKLGAMMNHVA